MIQVGWRKLLEGWQVAAVVVGAALLTGALVAPHSIAPANLPLPRIDRREQLAELQRDRGRARLAVSSLPPPVRLVGEAMRRVGIMGDAPPHTRQIALKQLRRLTREARRREGDEALLQLRSLQSHLLVAASRNLASKPASKSLKLQLAELGGPLVVQGTARGWFDDTGFVGDERDLVELFKIHWARAAGLSTTHPFSPSLNQWRIYYRFLLSQPGSPGADPAKEARTKAHYVTELQAHDALYPALLARAVLMRQAGNCRLASQLLSSQLRHDPDTPRSMLVRNHLASCR